ncbi:Vacuolar ATPase assembly integral membrane protein VMA21-like domain protein [Metarhizium rileyi]|uniref:Vacuolar ATPase assembly integral membrane protein vma21 n=1 Tax=Metarhizium rileyi (strain RCEF 4871) TaxID=1649241 RepID=A0A167B7C4_METRR|nr:Vacuolar ATPase assembly integral membrane protein VMA21-like domain protein [Metarhizium rileyi RCEF 4871]TWU75394.1 vacuolar ATPase assembly integral membrane protein vma21 [Metarhizium rileyi]
MATRRIIGSEKTILEKDDQPEEKSNISPAVPKHVIFKLLGFTFAMIVVPIGSYFLTVHTVFKGNSSLAGGLAALLANVVLISYVIVAMKEDDSSRLGESIKKPDTKKDQ